MKALWERIYNGIIKANPAFILMLGMCPTLAVTTSAINGLGMGLSTLVVLPIPNALPPPPPTATPPPPPLPAFIVIVASFVTVVELLMEAYMESLYASLGIYIPLIVVNCIILGRAEAYASKNPPLLSLFDGLGMGLGFTIALVIIGSIRELLGAGSIFGYALPGNFEPIAFFVRAPGAFLVLAVVVAIMNAVGIKNRANKVVEGCDGCCASCGSSGCDKTEAKV